MVVDREVLGDSGPCLPVFGVAVKHDHDRCIRRTRMGGDDALSVHLVRAVLEHMKRAAFAALLIFAGGGDQEPLSSIRSSTVQSPSLT